LLQRHAELLGRGGHLDGCGGEPLLHVTGQRDRRDLRPTAGTHQHCSLIDAAAAGVEPGELGAAHDLDVGDGLVPLAVEEVVVIAAVDLAEPLGLAAHVLVERLGH
jgi:hypothetical protein